MRKKTIERAIKVAEYIIETKQTVREIAVEFGSNKSTVHMDLRHRLPDIDEELAKEVHAILDQHKASRHLNGGQKTKEKWQLLRTAE